MGKASVSNITVSLGFFVFPKALAIPRVSVVASLFAILRPSTSRFHPLALYCPKSWHLTAKTPPPGGTQLLPPLWLAPYCYSPTSTLLLTFLAGIRSAWWLRSPSSPSDHVTLPRLRLVVV